MPAVKKLHQSSENNSKATYMFRHSFQALGLLVCAPLLSVPLTSRIHEGLVFSNPARQVRTAVSDRTVVGELEAGVLLVVDAYYGRATGVYI